MYIRDVIWPWHVRHQGSSWAQDFETSHGNSGNGKGWNPAKSCEKNNQLLIGTTIFFLCSTYGAGLKYRRSFKWALQVRWLLHVCLQKWLQECPWPMQLLRQRRPTIVEVSGRLLKAQTLECSISGAKHTHKHCLLTELFPPSFHPNQGNVSVYVSLCGLTRPDRFLDYIVFARIGLLGVPLLAKNSWCRGRFYPPW